MKKISNKKGQFKKVTKFELASQDKVNDLEKYVGKVLEALGHPEALVTDESRVFDFTHFIMDEQEYEKDKNEQLLKAFKELGIEIDEDDYIYRIADKLRTKLN